ncbi:hypothetical protein [Neolewinella aurantiaca]|uniref:hypothetical protein n=1 Tax=Neolewinella aurantiaca TaxID=2602767 RepID=UPI00164F4E7D|nr:hypothetical protein [Neolewinella aurantiaca]
MKYVFFAIAFFSLGYVVPTFAPFTQVLIAGLVLGLMPLAFYVYAQTTVSLSIPDEH